MAEAGRDFSGLEKLALFSIGFGIYIGVAKLHEVLFEQRRLMIAPAANVG